MKLQAGGFLIYEAEAGLRPTSRGMALLDTLLPLLHLSGPINSL